MAVYAVLGTGERHLLFVVPRGFDVQGWADAKAPHLRLLGVERLIYEEV
jgi:hypothetical protein